jgi:ferredoxin
MLRKLFAKRPAPRVTLQPDGRSFEVGRNQTVLEKALAEGIAYPHDCTVGTCGSCRSRLLSGKVDAITPFGYTLSREELAAGYILACQAVPESDLIIEVDLEDLPVRKVRARLVETRELTHDIKAVTWECEAPVDYKAGQYMAVTWPGAPASRSYSFAAAPAEGGTTRLTSFIRKVPGGAFTFLAARGQRADPASRRRQRASAADQPARGCRQPRRGPRCDPAVRRAHAARSLLPGPDCRDRRALAGQVRIPSGAVRGARRGLALRHGDRRDRTRAGRAGRTGRASSLPLRPPGDDRRRHCGAVAARRGAARHPLRQVHRRQHRSALTGLEFRPRRGRFRPPAFLRTSRASRPCGSLRAPSHVPRARPARCPSASAPA